MRLLYSHRAGWRRQDQPGDPGCGQPGRVYPDGIWFVDLAPVSDPEHVAPTILQALGIPERAQVTITALLQEWLRPKRLLLILDNFEQVLDAAPLVSAILSAAPEVQVLVTSRRPTIRANANIR